MRRAGLVSLKLGDKGWEIGLVVLCGTLPQKKEPMVSISHRLRVK